MRRDEKGANNIQQAKDSKGKGKALKVYKQK